MSRHSTRATRWWCSATSSGVGGRPASLGTRRGSAWSSRSERARCCASRSFVIANRRSPRRGSPKESKQRLRSASGVGGDVLLLGDAVGGQVTSLGEPWGQGGRDGQGEDGPWP